MSVDIAIRDLRKSYAGSRAQGAATILDGFSLHVDAGELVAFVGPSGCGKTTLLNMLAGLDHPTRGSIAFDEGATDANVSVVFQQPRLVEWLTVEQNVALAFERSDGAVRHGPDTVHELLEKVGLAEHAAAYPQFLSGGQKQRVAIARAFAIQPDVLLLDEPFSALDELTARRLRQLLQDLWRVEDATRPTGVLVTHNMLEAAFLADRIYVLNGKPARIAAVIEVDVPRPRDPDDPRLFEVHRAVMRALG